jgi:hypothetical protein
MSNRLNGLLTRINNAGLANGIDSVYTALLGRMAKSLSGEREQEDPYADSAQLLNACGPAAAQAAFEHALGVCQKNGLYTDIAGRLNSNLTYNLAVMQDAGKLMVRNDSGSEFSGFQAFSSVLRQFLLPRYAYLDFDRVVDPRHRVDEECGYPKFITPIMYRYMYDRDDIARRVVDIYPDECWATEPEVYESDDEKEDTPFELAWQALCESHNVLQNLYRMDKLCGVGHYGALLLGLDDGQDLEKPINEPDLLAGARDSAATQQRQLLYMRPFDEYLSFIHQYETDVMHPRYGLPKFYNLVFLDMTIDAAGASIGTRLNRRVHWSRVVHVADNLHTSLVFGTPRQQPVFNRLLDLRKIKGGSSEMFWKGGFPGIAFEIDPRFVADDPEFDKEEMKREIGEYEQGLSRYLRLIGIKANSLAPAVASPKDHVRIQMEAIACHYGVPLRVFLGSEEGRLASTEDKQTWNRRLGRRYKGFLNPYLLRNFINRLIAVGILPRPQKGYKIHWPDLSTPTDEDKANLALKWTQALSQYVASGVIHLIQPLDYFTMIVGLKPEDAIRVIDIAKKEAGFKKLLKVDPSQGAGVNGKRKSGLTPGSKKGTKGTLPKSRDTATKSSEGMTS